MRQHLDQSAMTTLEDYLPAFMDMMLVSEMFQKCIRILTSEALKTFQYDLPLAGGRDV